jgi:hypothetical protein
MRPCSERASKKTNVDKSRRPPRSTIEAGAERPAYHAARGRRGNGGAGVTGIYCRFKLPIPADKFRPVPTETEIG